MSEPTVGRIVHYTSYGTPGGEYASECRAAVVTAVGEDGNLSLCVLNPTGMFFNTEVRHGSADQGGTWHWPERVESDENVVQVRVDPGKSAGMAVSDALREHKRRRGKI